MTTRTAPVASAPSASPPIAVGPATAASAEPKAAAPVVPAPAGATPAAPPAAAVGTAVAGGPTTYPWHRVHDIARDVGLAAALHGLAEQIKPRAIPFGPAGHAVVPADVPATGPRCGADSEHLFTVALDGDHVVALRLREAADLPPGHDDGHLWAVGVSWVRLGASRWLLRRCLRHARERIVGDGPLVQQQMVQGMIAEALTEQLEAEALLEGARAPGMAVLTEANVRIRSADRTLLRLLGASSFQAGLPSHTVWVSELLADAYIGPETIGGSE